MKEVYDFLTRKIKLSKSDIVVVGVSAGPDSMALLYILIGLREKIGFRIVVAHVNHNVRKESYEEALFLEDYCRQHDIIFESMIINNYGDDNFHNEARNIRYRFYDELIEKYGANYLMTGHHGDDLVETILMRLTRGSTLRGYSGFSRVVDRNSYQIVRPLISVTKSEIEDFDKKNNIPYRIDKSNYKDKYTRNRYRMKVLPFLKEEERDVHKKFLKFSEILEEYDCFLDKITKREIDKVYIDGVIIVDEFKHLADLIGKRIIEYIFGNLYKDDIVDIDDKHINLVMKAIYSNRSSIQFNLPNDYVVIKEYNKVYLKKEIDEILPYDIEINNEVFLPNGMVLKKVLSCDGNGNDILRIDSKMISLPLRVRTRRNGDKMEVMNMYGTKKVSDILIDAKIPLKKRDSWPIVVDSQDRIIWIPKVKKSKYNRLKDENCDIIIKCL